MSIFAKSVLPHESPDILAPEEPLKVFEDKEVQKDDEEKELL
jgi:hypothetical protein